MRHSILVGGLCLVGACTHPGPESDDIPEHLWLHGAVGDQDRAAFTAVTGETCRPGVDAGRVNLDRPLLLGGDYTIEAFTWAGQELSATSSDPLVAEIALVGFEPQVTVFELSAVGAGSTQLELFDSGGAFVDRISVDIIDVADTQITLDGGDAESSVDASGQVVVTLKAPGLAHGRVSVTDLAGQPIIGSGGATWSVEDASSAMELFPYADIRLDEAGATEMPGAACVSLLVREAGTGVIQVTPNVGAVRQFEIVGI